LKSDAFAGDVSTTVGATFTIVAVVVAGGDAAVPSWTTSVTTKVPRAW
jgi:hypothetical protein